MTLLNKLLAQVLKIASIIQILKAIPIEYIMVLKMVSTQIIINETLFVSTDMNTLKK